MTTATERKPGDYIRDAQTKTCNHCGAADLAWWKSTRTGKWILVNTAPSQDDVKRARGVRYIAPWSPHRCERELARRAERDAELRKAYVRNRTASFYEQIMGAEEAGDHERVRELLIEAQQARSEAEAEWEQGATR